MSMRMLYKCLVSRCHTCHMHTYEVRQPTDRCSPLSLYRDCEPSATKRFYTPPSLPPSALAWAVEAQVRRLNLTVEVLVNAAGVCRVGRVESCADQDLSAQLLLNVVGTSRLTRLFAQGTYLCIYLSPPKCTISPPPIIHT